MFLISFAGKAVRREIGNYKIKINLLTVSPSYRLKPINDKHSKVDPFRHRWQFLYINGVSFLIKDRETVRQATETDGVRYFPDSKSYIYFGYANGFLSVSFVKSFVLSLCLKTLQNSECLNDREVLTQRHQEAQRISQRNPRSCFH